MVFEAMDVLHHRQCALKVFKPEKKQKKIEREIQALKHLAGGPNIISLFDVVEDIEVLLPYERHRVGLNSHDG
jgi:casein kinase II subunit alpha